VPVQDGLFNVMLGSLVPIPVSIWQESELYLGVKIGSDAEMSPREKLTIVPMAASAEIAQVALDVPDGSISKEKFADSIHIDLIQSGIYHCTASICPDWNLNIGSGPRDYSIWINFPEVYDSVPAVVVNISKFDLVEGSNYRLSINPKNITTQGFDLTFSTWSDSLVYGASATWIAYGE